MERTEVSPGGQWTNLQNAKGSWLSFNQGGAAGRYLRIVAVDTASRRLTLSDPNGHLSLAKAGDPVSVTAPYRISGRELEVLGLAARGLSNARIADALRISESTVKCHLASVYEKMGVGSRSEASHRALSEGWIAAGGAAPEGAVYRCAVAGCGREVVEVRPPSVRQQARLSCHGREMDRTGPPGGW